ncbi:hypothetical protein K9L67_02115 [Candidatus Woesearchaeota archaeon]|nr:hypothetical protein [Candidatus Woesearchaeota archaeon]MCF7900999.1 hypothetical protein [Candidatus Woesearchaeota archaeon]MCF8013285.1 hypothetical protein [Candidatus Woesearchaeota archaeon]
MSSVKKFYSLPSLYKIGLRGRKEKNFIITSGIDLTNEFIDFNEDSKYKVVGLKYCDWQYSFKPLNLDKIKLYDDITLIKSVLEEKL